ncbi:MAG: glycosyltransferase family 39 protein [Thermodesulfovibrionales bacterium]|nr:glycosyltransferase family 39 protein [Thermodesulfovibrionales bacterium]
MIGYPYILGLSFKIFGQSDFTVILFNGVFFVALILLVYLLAYELSGNTVISLIAALLVSCMKCFLDHSLQAEPNIMYSSLYVAFFYFYIKYPGRPLIYGIMLGLLHLVRANTQFVFIAFFLMYIFHGKENLRERFLDSGKLSIGFLIGITPHLVRNYMIIGNPFFSLYGYSFLLFTKSFPTYSVWTQISDVNPIMFVMSHPGEMILKSYHWFWRLLENSVDFYTPVVLLLTGATFFMPLKNSRVRMLRIITIVGIIVQTALLLPMGPVPYYYMFFFPVMIIVSVINVGGLLKKYGPIVLSFGLIAFAFTAMPYWKSPQPINPFISMGKQVEKLTGKDALILTDMPWELAWYADRKAIWLPYDLDTLKTISQTLKPSYVILSGKMYVPYKDMIWMRMLNDSNYAKSLGYRLESVISFQNSPIALMYKTMDSSDAL